MFKKLITHPLFPVLIIAVLAGAMVYVAVFTALPMMVEYSRSQPVEGFYWTGREDMPFSVGADDTASFYLGGTRFVRISGAGDDVEVEEFTGPRPSASTMESVFEHCFREVVRENVTLGLREFTTGSTTYACGTVIKSLWETRPGLTYALYPYDGYPILVWDDEDQSVNERELPAGTVVEVLETPEAFVGGLHIRVDGKELWTNNDVVKFIVPEP